MLERQAIAFDDLLLEPIDVIVGHEFASRDGDRHGDPRRRQEPKNRERAAGVDAGVKQTARMAVYALVPKLIGSLQKEIAGGVLCARKAKPKTMLVARSGIDDILGFCLESYSQSVCRIDLCWSRCGEPAPKPQ